MLAEARLKMFNANFITTAYLVWFRSSELKLVEMAKRRHLNYLKSI